MTSAQVLSHFREIMTIPRESGHEEHIIAYLQKFAADRGMDCRTDEAGNVLITIPATPGRENAPTLILQSHSDMVCEKNSGVEHDFSKDPIKAVVEDGWLIAKDTTLGADCGIGIAAQLAVLEDKELPHGRIECLFTTFALKPDFLTGSILINLDSEDEGELFIGCAGGIDTTAKFHYTPVPAPAGKVCVKAGFCGGIGGHSGDDIDKGRSNAVQSLARLLFRVWSEVPAVLCSIDGGNKRNAIAREASAVIAVSPGDASTVRNILEEVLAELKDEYSVTDPDIAPVWESGLPVPAEAGGGVGAMARAEAFVPEVAAVAQHPAGLGRGECSHLVFPPAYHHQGAHRRPADRVDGYFSFPHCRKLLPVNNTRVVMARTRSRTRSP